MGYRDPVCQATSGNIDNYDLITGFDPGWII